MYSQNQEEKIILEYFDGKKGSFIDIGSNDGMTLSNTRKLAELGWRGVFVEPSPKAFYKLKDNYKGMNGFYFYQFALSTNNGMKPLWDSNGHLSESDHGLLSTLHHSETERWPGQQYEKIEVRCFRWKTFLNRLSIKDFDFISLDTEGEDYAILKQIDLRKTSMVCLEWNSRPALKEQYDPCLIGFNVIYTSPENLIYAR